MEMIYELHKLQIMLDGCKEELSTARKGYMVRSRKSTAKRYNYAEVVKLEKGYIKRGITRDRDAIYAHARKRFLLELIAILEANVKGMSRLLKTYRSMDFRAIVASLPEAYEDLPEEAYFGSTGHTEWETETYARNPYYPEDLRHITLRGFRVRSKSELYIASQLDLYKIPYRYEMEIRLGQRYFYPDFVIRNPRNGELTYWEHCGKVNDAKYMSSHYDKVMTYSQYGIVPWKNLIITYDDESGNMNAVDIDHTIKGLLIRLEKIESAQLAKDRGY